MRTSPADTNACVIAACSCPFVSAIHYVNNYAMSVGSDLNEKYYIYLLWFFLTSPMLTHWGRVTHICVGVLTIIGSNNGLSPRRRQAIILTSSVILLIGPLGTNFNEILIDIHIFSVTKMHLKMSSGKWRPFCLGLNVLMLMAFVDPGLNGFRGYFSYTFEWL